MEEVAESNAANIPRKNQEILSKNYVDQTQSALNYPRLSTNYESKKPALFVKQTNR